MNTDNLILRETDNLPLINKDDTLTNAEIDGNFINIYNDFLSLSQANDPTLIYDVDRSYSVDEFATYNGRLWIATDVSTGVTPIEGSAEWNDVFPTVLAHEKNKDTILDEGGANETTVSEIRAFIDAGLTSTTNLSLSTKTATSFKIESSTGADVTIPQANVREAGLLNAEDKVKLDNIEGINTGDQTLVSLNAEDVTNKVTDFTTINDTLYPTTQAVDTYITAVVPDLVETFIDGAVELNTNKATNFTTINDTLYPSVKAVDDQLDLKVDGNTAITGATKTKITYDSKGLVTNGVDATTADISDSLNKRYVTDANLTVIGNTSGTNTGDQIISDATLTTTDITTNNFSTTKHGFVPKGTNTGKYLKDDGTWSTISAGGLTYFTEAQSTASPNATVNVDSLTAIASTTNADFVIQPKGAGAILAQIPDGTASGGDKRGQYAVDFQRVRSYTGGYVASGNYSFISGGTFNKATNDYASVVGGYFNISSGAHSVTGGYQNTASSTACVSFGYANTASGTYALALGMSNSATNTGSTVFGGYNISNGFYSTALGYGSNTFSISGRYCYSSLGSYSSGDAQSSKLILKKSTTDATLTALSVDNGAANAINQLVLQNNNVFRVKGSITGKQSGSTNVGVWDIDCVIVRGANAASTVIASSNVNLVVNTGSFGTPTLTANTTLGCLTVSVIGALTTNIQWTCVIDTTEVIYA